MSCRRIPSVTLVLGALVCSACGGSSSETPPPLEPLPVNLHYNRSATALPGEQPLVESDAGTRRAEVEANGTGDGAESVESTWGDERGAKPPTGD